MKRLLILVFCLLLTACATRNQQVAAPSAQPEMSPDQQMADFLGGSQPGSSASFSGTSYGALVTVTSRENYISALGELCREGLVKGYGGITRIAACRDKEESQWHLSPNIFPQGSL